MASTMKRGFLNTSKGKKAIQVRPENPTPNTKQPPPSEASEPLVKPLPYGKVKDVEIDKDFKYDANVYREKKPSTANEDVLDAITMTTVPPQYLHGPDDPDGHTEWLVKGNTKKKVLQTPGHPKPIPKTRQVKFVIKPTATMGMGMFATRDIPYGELILSERPLLVFPRSLNLGYKAPAHYSLEQFHKVVLMETEKKLELMLARMKEEDRNAYIDLSNSHKEDGSGPLVGIMRTNGFGIGGLADGPQGAPITVSNGYLAVCKLASRINHSCIPNVRFEFDITSFSMQFTALSDIKGGEQIMFSYCKSGPSSSKAERAEKLLPYGIVCTCPACEGRSSSGRFEIVE